MPRWIETIALATLAVAIAEFPSKLVWPYGGETIALLMALSVLAYGVRPVFDSSRAAAFLFVAVVLVVYLLNQSRFLGGPMAGVALNRLVIFVALLPFLLARIPDDALRRIEVAVVAGCTWATLVGWYRFATGSGGIASEHVLGYWGIRYEVATRNGDVLYPLAALLFVNRVGSPGLRLVALTTSLPAIILSYSRSAWIAVATLFIGRLKAAHLGLGAAIAVLLTIVLGRGRSLSERFFSIFEQDSRASNTERIAIAEQAIRSLSPFGTGPGVFRAGNVSLARHAENLFLTVGVEMGVFALAALLLLWATILIRTTEKRAVVALTIFVIFNTELDNVFLWLLVGLLIHHSAARRTEVASSQLVPRAA